jgi:hypothetical protein
MGVNPPSDYNSVRQIAMQTDTNFDGKISKMELYTLFKKIQGF